MGYGFFRQPGKIAPAPPQQAQDPLNTNRQSVSGVAQGVMSKPLGQMPQAGYNSFSKGAPAGVMDQFKNTFGKVGAGMGAQGLGNSGIGQNSAGSQLYGPPVGGTNTPDPFRIGKVRIGPPVPTTPPADGGGGPGGGEIDEGGQVSTTPPAPVVDPAAPPSKPGTWNGEMFTNGAGKKYKWWVDKWLELDQNGRVLPGQITGGVPRGTPPPSGGGTPGQPPYQDPDKMALHTLLGDTNSAFHAMTKYDLEQLMPWIKNDPSWASLSDANARGLAQQQLGQLLNNPNGDINQIRDYVARIGNIGNGQEYMQAAEQAIGNPNSGFHQRATKQELLQMFPAFAQDMQSQTWTDAQARHIIGQYMGTILRGNGPMSAKRSILQFLQRFG